MPAYALKEQELFTSIDAIISGKPLVNPNISRGRVRLERAPNAIKFIESEKFLSGPQLWPEQFNIIRDFYELLCPGCNDMPSIATGEVPRNEQILFEFARCPECGLRKFQVADQLRFPNTLVGVAGQRSSKSAIAACIASYHLHEALVIENLPAKLGLLTAQDLDFSFAAAAGLQASETVYAQFKGLYDASPWFQSYKNELQQAEKADPKLNKGDLYWDTDLSIVWKEKHIRCRSITTNAATQRGPTRIWALIDELSWLDSGESKRSANEVYRALKNSLLTVRIAVAKLQEAGDYSLPDGLLACVSSPLFSEDRSMQLLVEAEKNKKIYAFHRATWELNPTISRKDLDAEFEADPVGAERDFGAKPPGAENPFIKDPTVVDLCIDATRRNMFDLREEFFEQKIQDHVFRYIKMALTDVRYKNLAEYVIHCDAGEKKDSFCMAIGHKELDRCIIDGAIEVRPVAKGSGKTARDVHFPSMINLILALQNRGIAIKLVTYDRWNSTDHIQLLIDAGIPAYAKNLNRDDHVRFLQAMNTQIISFPALEPKVFDPKIDRNVPCAKAMYEVKHLEDDGMTVDHSRTSSNDISQCFVGVHRLVMFPELVTGKQLGRGPFGTNPQNTFMRMPAVRSMKFRR